MSLKLRLKNKVFVIPNLGLDQIRERQLRQVKNKYKDKDKQMYDRDIVISELQDQVEDYKEKYKTVLNKYVSDDGLW